MIYVISLILLAGLIYLGFTSHKFAASVQQERTIKPELVKSTLVKLAGGALVMGISMDMMVNTFGLFTLVNLGLVVGAFLFSVELKKQELRKDGDN
jgi:hypothetical protein